MTETEVLTAPCDFDAEQAVIGCSISGDAGYWRAASVVAADDFYKPAHRELFIACAQLRDLAGPDIDTEATRIEEAARLAGVPVEEVRRLVDERPVMWDTSGGFARRVQQKAEARRLMAIAGEMFNRLGEGEAAGLVVADLGASLLGLVQVPA